MERSLRRVVIFPVRASRHKPDDKSKIFVVQLQLVLMAELYSGCTMTLPGRRTELCEAILVLLLIFSVVSLF